MKMNKLLMTSAGDLNSISLRGNIINSATKGQVQIAFNCIEK